jgi:hypothetical protein
VKKQTVRWCLLASFLFPYSLAQSQTLAIPQIVDGGAWLTTIAVTNTSASQTVANLSFYQNSTGGVANATSPWSLNFVEMTSAQAQNLVVPAGSTVFLHTPGTAATTTIGWGQVSEADGAGAVAAYAIFTQRIAGRTDQDGTAPGAAAAARILVPFDNTNTAVSTMAIANPSSSSSVTVNVGIRTSSGTTQPTSITLPPQGHASFSFPTQFAASAGVSGLAEFYSPGGTFSILALKFITGAFTTAPVYTESGLPILASSSGNSPNFDGTYSGTFTGTAGSGSVTASISGGTVTVTIPAQGTGTITNNGQITFGTVIDGTTSCNFSGSIVISGATATGSGTFNCPSVSISGNWTITRH